MCQGFMLPALRSFLMEDQSMTTFSFVLNNQAAPIFDEVEEDSDEENPEAQKRQSRRSTRKSTKLESTIEREMHEVGMESDLDVMYLLYAGVMHPRLEILQICQPLQDHFETQEYLNYYN